MPKAGTRPPSGLNRGDAIAAAGGLVLLVLMFAIEWYGVDARSSGVPPRPGGAGAENAWHALTVVRWVMLLTILVTVGATAIHARRPERMTVALARLGVASLGTLTAVLVAVRVLIALPSADSVVDQKLGAIFGLIAALAIAFGGNDAIREQRDRARAARPGENVTPRR